MRVTLESAHVCVIPFDALQSLAKEEPSLQRQLQRAMSLEIVRKQRLMLLLDGTPADQRVAAFLLDLAQRARARGLLLTVVAAAAHDAARDRQLLGLTLETVSRALSRLQRAGLLFVRWRQVRIADLAGLQ
jgi:CRP/FNR family transcriptional regulator